MESYRRVCVFIVCLVVLGAAGGAAQQSASATPAALTPRTGHAMATAGKDGGVIVIGGSPAAGDSAWRFSGGTWQPIAPGGPANRLMIAAAFDSRRNVLVAFGGVGARNGSRYGETWEWNGRLWEERDVRGPGARDHHAMAYDAARGVVVMFGGGVPGAGPSGNPPTDTWTWDGRAWTRAATIGPTARYLHAMAYDSARQRIVMTAGNRSARPYDVLADTWEWDGTSWKEVGRLTPSTSPASR